MAPRSVGYFVEWEHADSLPVLHSEMLLLAPVSSYLIWMTPVAPIMAAAKAWVTKG